MKKKIVSIILVLILIISITGVSLYIKKQNANIDITVTMSTVFNVSNTNVPYYEKKTDSIIIHII